MYLFDECRCSPTSTRNKNKLHQRKKEYIKPNQKKSNFDFLLLFSNAPTRPRPCQSITLIFFHHPPIILKLFPTNLLVFLKKLHEGSILLQETKIHREEIYFFDNLKTMHPFKTMFHGEMHMDDGNVPKKF